MPASVMLALPPTRAGVAIPTMPHCNLHHVYLSASKAQAVKAYAIRTKQYYSSVPAVSAAVQNGIFASRCAYLAPFPHGVGSAIHKRVGHFPSAC